jgi:hypothetical protein
MMAKKPDPTDDLLRLVEETAADLRTWAARLELAVQANQAEAEHVQEIVNGGTDDAGADSE